MGGQFEGVLDFASGEVSHVEIAMVLEGIRAEAGAPLVRLPLVVNNVDTVAADLDDVAARDSRGPLTACYRRGQS